MKKAALVIALGMALAGCGGGSDGGSTPTTPTKPETSPRAVLGTIDSVDAPSNQIVVNGYRYDVASVGYGNNALSIADLQKDMMVQVLSGTKAGVQVDVEPTLVGAVTAVDHVAKTFTVNGINLTFAGLSAEIDLNDWVMVSSLPSATMGYKVLSVVEFEADKLGNQVEVEGRISSKDENTGSFKLGANLTVNYANLSHLQVGQWVEVEGTMNGAELDAREVEIDNYDDLDEGNEVEGVVTWVANDLSSFELSYRGRFAVNASTRFEDGNKSHLKQGALVEVQSALRNGQQVATEVEFDNDNDYVPGGNWQEVEAEGNAKVIDSVAGTFSVWDEETYKTVNFTTDSNTVFEGVTMLTLDGEYVEVEAVVIDGKNVAREIERDYRG
ncbi:hypothetical protein ABT56_02200 [Photobacterium aquae]|uniref:DUF5666 domain-containing protein n=1 Tax=Photobacterium aquae TaxID=1195763 RepID=A0A0J1HBL1_9GAMM|nr:DUF5666 domain-containing protein [Photobacterium aquae]KLV09035.1 hypothetical protein ABT56_02200 [Photobacterium aquae]